MNTKSMLSLLFLLAICITPVAGDSGSTRKDERPNAADTTHARLGVVMLPVPEVLASHLPDVINNERGVLVSEVMNDSAAEKAGLKKYDILVRFGDQDLFSPEQLMKLVRNEQPGNTIEIQYVRGGKLVSTQVKLGEEKVKETGYLKWPNFGSTFQLPWSALRPSFWSEAKDADNERPESTAFESLMMNKHANGTYSVSITIKDADGKTVEREFKGTRQKIRDAISADTDLPQGHQHTLLRMQEISGQGLFMDSQLSRHFQWIHDLLQWPHADFSLQSSN